MIDRKQRNLKTRRWVRILTISLAVVFVFIIGGVFAANYAINKVLDSMVDSAMVDGGALLDHPDLNKVGSSLGDDRDSNINNQYINKSDEDASSSNGKVKNNEVDATEWEYKGAEVSVNQANTVRDNITIAEKAKLLSVFSKKLTIEDLKKIQELVSGGLSEEEKKLTRAIILDRLTADEYNELIEIAKKYGLSQGRPFEEVIKEK